MALTKATLAFQSGDATLETARQLSEEGTEDLLDLVDALLADKQRGHLELLGQAGLEKKVRKAARKAAHRLESAGVASDVVVAESKAINFSAAIELDQVALISAPGLRGQGWHAFCGLKNLDPFELVIREGGEINEMNLLRSLSMSRMKRALRDIKDEPSTGVPILADAALAIRTIDSLTESTRGSDGNFPTDWTHALAWRDLAVELGADPATRDARALLAKELATLQDEPDLAVSKILLNPEAGVMMPPTHVLEALFREVQHVTHSDRKFERAEFDEHLRGLAMAQLDTWLGDAAEGLRLARCLDASADCLLATGAQEAALHALWLADHLRSVSRLPHEYLLLSEVMMRLMAIDSAWEHYSSDDHAHCS